MKNVMHASGGFNLSAWALAHRQLVAFLMLMVTVTGVMSFLNLPRSEDPAFTIKTAVVSAQWPGATVKDTVSFVTDTLEKKLQEIPHLDYIESYTRPGSSVIFVNLRDDTPPSEVAGIWYSVRKKMDDIRASLPDGTTTPAVDDEFDDTYGTIYGFTSDGFTPRQLRDTVDDIRTSLLAVPGTGKVTLLGDSEQQVVIAFDPLKLSGMGLDLQQVTAALQAQNAVTPAGRIRTSQKICRWKSVAPSHPWTACGKLCCIPETVLSHSPIWPRSHCSRQIRPHRSLGLTVNQHSGWRFRWLAVEILLILVGR